MGEVKITLADVVSVIAALLVALVGVAIVICIIAFLLTGGAPLLAIGMLLGMGVLGIAVLVLVAATVIPIWYIIYALIKHYAFGKEKDYNRPNKAGENTGNKYTIDRIRKS